MAHNIFGERFLGRRQPAWHGLGSTFDGPTTATQAVAAAGMDYRVFTAPLVAMADDGPVDLPRVAILREPTHDDPETRFLGIAGTNYEVINNADIAAILDPLAREWPVETAGALGSGEKMFMTLRVGDADVAGDPVVEYFLVTEGKSGGESVKLAYTPVRVVCQNTLVMGLRSATVQSAVVHTTGARRALKFQVDIMSQLRIAKRDGLESLVALARTPLGEADISTILSAAYPEPRKSAKARLADAIASSDLSDLQIDELMNRDTGRELVSATSLHNYMSERAQVFRDAALDLYQQFNDEHPAHARTAWALYNAVVECEDYRNGADSADASAIFGVRAATKSRAFQACLSLALSN